MQADIVVIRHSDGLITRQDHMAQTQGVSLTDDQPFDRRALVWSVLRVIFTGVGMLVFYFLLPFTQVTPLESIARVVVGVVILVAGVWIQLRSIMKSRRPRLRALESVGLSFWLLVLVFATIYMSLSAALPLSFSEQLNQVGALYYAVSILSTVGFGDISAVSDVARLVVVVQMLLGLVLLGAGVGLFTRTGERAAAAKKL